MRLSKIFSIILHPIFTPTIVFHIIVVVNPSLVFFISNFLPLVYLIIVLSTCVLPLVSVLIKLKNKTLNNLEINDNKKRHHAIFPTIMWVALGYYILHKINLLIYAPFIQSIFLGYLLLLTLSLLVSFKWKISLHSLSIGGATGIFIGLNEKFGGFFELIIVFFILAGIVGFARIKESAHNESQIYIGFICGLLIQYFSIIYF